MKGDADTKANQLITLKQQKYDQLYAEEQEKVSLLYYVSYIFAWK